MGTGDILLGDNPSMDYHPVQGGSSNTPRHASCHGNRYKLRPSLRGRRLKGKGKGVFGARETRGAREERGRETPARGP